MSTAIAVYNSEGCVGRCDARCHDALQPECDCICGGRLHGCGSERAIAQNTEDLGVEALLESWAERHDLSADGLRLAFGEPVLPLG